MFSFLALPRFSFAANSICVQFPAQPPPFSLFISSLLAIQALRVQSNGSDFSENVASRGASVYAEPTAVAIVNEAFGAFANQALLTAATSNVALEYGPGIASPPTTPAWLVSPTGGVAVMAGTNLCDTGFGCVATLADGYGNTVTTPTVVEIVLVQESSDPEAGLDGPQYVLVADGQSEPIADLRPTVNPMGGTPSIEVVSVISVSFDGGIRAPVLTVTSLRCEPGYGAVNTNGAGLVCEPCSPGNYSADLSWGSCERCEAGYASNTTESTTCSLCAPGYGWNADEGAGTCDPCPIGTFTDAPTWRVPCNGCASGLTTDDVGSIACAIPAGPSSSFDAVVIIVTAAIALVALVALVVSCLKKRDARHGAIGTVMLSVMLVWWWGCGRSEWCVHLVFWLWMPRFVGVSHTLTHTLSLFLV